MKKGGVGFYTHRLCTLVSMAILPRLLELGFPGRPLGSAKDIELDFENWRRRSSEILVSPCFDGMVQRVRTHSVAPRPDDCVDVARNDFHARVRFARTKTPNL